MKVFLYVLLMMTMLLNCARVLPMNADRIRKGFALIGACEQTFGRSQRKRAVSLLLCIVMLGSYIPAADVARADTVNQPTVLDGQVVVNGVLDTQIGEVTYREETEAAADGEAVSSVWMLNDTTAVVRAGKDDSLSFKGTISAPEGEQISWIRVDVYDAASQEPYTVGEEYFYAMNVDRQLYDLSNIPPMKIADAFGTSDYVLEEGKQYIVMLQAGDSKGNLLKDLDAEVDGEQGPAVLLTIKLSPENCTHPHANYRYILHDSGETRVYCYGDSLVHQIEPLYERYCGLCDRYLMNIWGHGTPEEHSMVDGVCSVCGYVDGSETYAELPVIQSISSSVGEVFAAGTEVTFAAVASAEAGLSEICLYIDDELRLSENVTGTIGSLKCTINDLAIGEHTVKATVVDADGWYNEASSTVMVLQADSETCLHINTVVRQTSKCTSVDDGYHQFVVENLTHCNDCGTDISVEEIKEEPVEHDAWENGMCGTCGHVLTASTFSMISVEMLSETALINAEVQFQVTASGTDTCQAVFYDEVGEVDSAQTVQLVDGVGTFNGWAGESCSERLVVSCTIDGAEYSDELDITYTAIGQIETEPQLKLMNDPVIGQDYVIAWESVTDAQWYNVNVLNPYGENWYYSGQEISCTVPGYLFCAAGEYDISLEAACAGYTSTYDYQTVIAHDTAVDTRVTVSADPTNAYFGGQVELKISAPGAEKMELYYNGRFDKEISGEMAEEIWYAGEDFTLTARAWIDNEWTGMSEAVDVTVNQPEVNVPQYADAGKDVILRVSNAENYDWYCILDGGKIIGADEETRELIIPGGMLSRGEHGIEAVIRSEKLDWAEVSLIYKLTIEDEQAAAPMVSVDKTNVLIGEDVTFSVAVDGIENVRCQTTYVGETENWSGEYDLDKSGDTVTWTDSYGKAGVYSLSFSALIDGTWTTYSEPIEISVISLGTLAQTTITAQECITAGDEFYASWTAVENAEEYLVYIEAVGTDRRIYSEWIDNGYTNLYIPQDEIAEGDYTLCIRARAMGWEESLTTQRLTVEAPEKGKEFAYSISDGETISITKYLGSAVSVEIPAQIDGYTVTAIQNGAFKGSGIETVTIPEGVAIEYYAFNGCDNLTAVYMPRNAGTIDAYAFANCENIKLYVYKNSTAHTTALVQGIPYELYNVETEESGITAAVEDGPYYDGKGIKFTVTVPQGASKLRVYVDGKVTDNYDVVDSLTLTFYEYLHTKKTGTKYIQFSAYVNDAWTPLSEALALEVICYGILEAPQITLPEQVYAGQALTVSWTQVEEAEGYSIFLYRVDSEKDVYLTSRDIQENSYTFEAGVINRAGLFKVCIYAYGDGWKRSDYAEMRTEAVAVSDWAYREEYGCARITGYLGDETDVTVPDEIDGLKVKKIGKDAFSGLNVTSVKLSENVVEIVYDAFDNCASLTKLIIPVSVKYISEYAFDGCTQLTIYGYADSEAEAFALANDIAFVKMDASAAGEISFILENAQVYRRGKAKMTVTAPEAEKVRVYLDREIADTTEYALENGIVEITHYFFSEVGEYKMAVAQCVNGQWMPPCEAQTVTVVELPEPEILPIEGATAKTELTVSWEPVEGATGYGEPTLYFGETGTSKEYTGETDANGNCVMIWDAEDLPYEGTYRLEVYAFAEDGGYSSAEYEFEVAPGAVSQEEFVYTAKDGCATITEYVGTATDVVIPKTIDGYTVTAIDEWAFSYTSAVSVTLPDTIETVNAYAFGGDVLEEIHVNKNASVNKNAFVYCSEATVIYGYSGSSAELAAVAAGLEFVSVGSLAEAPTLTVEPDTVAYGEAYSWSVSHPDTDIIWIQRISETESGQTTTYPLADYEAGEFTKTADDFAENYTETITAKVLIDGDWSAIAQAQVKVICNTGVSEDYEYAVKNGTAQITNYLGADTDVIIPSEIDGYTVTSIGDSAFYGTDVVSVTFPNTLETLGMGVFYNCSSLESIYTNKRLLVEYKHSFQGCEDVTVYGYSGGSVEAAALAAGCKFVSLGMLSPHVPTLTITPATVAYGDEYEIACTLEGADMFQICGSFASASDSYTYSMLEEAEDGFLSMVWEATIYDGTPGNYTETYKVSARVNGEWTQYSEAKTVTVVFDDELILSAPQIHEITSPAPAHKELTISWDPVENAQEYEVWLHGDQGGMLELTTSTPEATSRIISLENFKQYFWTNCTHEEVAFDVEVTAKATGYSSATSTANFSARIYTFGKPVLNDVPEQVMQEDGFYVNWEAVEYADEVDTVYYEFLLIDEEGNETQLSSAWGDGAKDLTCWLWFGEYYAPVPGDYTLRVLVSAFDVPIRDSYSDYPIKVIAPFEYEIVDGNAIIVGYNGSDTNLTIPETINGYPVAKIGESAFEGNTTITDVRLPDSVTEIGAKAFKNCTALESIYGPGVTSIGEEAFYGCVNLVNVQFYEYIYYIGSNAFYAVDLPDYNQPLTVYVRDNEAISFEGNTVIGKVVYPEGVTGILARTHYANTKLGEVYLPTTLETIGSQAFAACGELNYVKLYDGITSIADDAFADSPNTVLYIYVKDMETVSYVEQYAIDHQIPYKKFLYTTEGVVSPTVSVSSQAGGGVIDVQENEVWVKVNEEIILGAAGNSAEVAHFYLNDELVGEYEFESAIVEIPHTFTQPGDVTFYAKTYSGTELVETSQTLTIHVVGVTLSADKEEPWTCETVHFEIASSNLSGTASVYADDTHLLDAEIVDGKAEWDYAFRKAGERTIKVLVNGLDPMEKTITVKCIDKLAAPVITAESTQLLEDGMAISWNAIEHADGYVVRVINTAGQVFFEEELAEADVQTISYTITADELQGAGTYAVFVMAYGYQYDQSESEAVNIAMVEEGSIFFTVDKTQVTTGEPVTFTVYASGATAAELIVDGKSTEIYDMTGNVLAVERPFSKSGDREVTFCALIDGVWTDPCEVQVIHVTSMGQLDKPEPTTKQYHRLGSDVEVTWATIEHADGYIIRVFDADGSKVYENEIEAAAETDVSETLPSETFVSCTVYSIDVYAYGAGYDQSEGCTTTEMLERLPGPEIVTPAADEKLAERSCELTWKAVEGAQSYVVTLAKKTADANGDAVYEKVWVSPNEVVNVGNDLSYLLSDLEYGAEYRVAVGAVLEGTGLEDATEVGWTERLFSVAMPELSVTITVNPETANEKQDVMITVSVMNAQVTAVLQDEADVLTPSRNEETETGREFDFVVTEQKQGTYTYTVIVEGTGEFTGIRNEKAVTVTYLDANAAVVHEITADPATCWAETDVEFEINANAMTERVKIQLYQGETLIAEKVTEPGKYDLLLGDVNTHVFEWSYHFADDGAYTLKVTPINADNESGAVYEMTYTVLERGKLPNPVITSPKNGSIETDESMTVTWDAVTLSPEMAFGGYCILLEKQNEKGEYAVVPAYTYVNTNETSYTLTGLEPGGAYRLHLFTLEQGHTEPDGSLHGEAEAVDFSYRTVPAFTLKNVIGGVKGEAITAEWTAPVWTGTSMKPDFYVVYWIGPDGKTIETQTVRNQTKSVLAGDRVVQDGRYSVDVYACMYESWGEYPQAHAVASGSYVVGKPEIAIIHPNADQNTYLVVEDFIEVLGEVQGGVRQVLARILDRNGNPIDLINYGDGSVVKHVIVQPDANGKFYVKLNMKDFLEESEGDKTIYCVQVLGFVSPDAPVIGQQDCEAECWIDTDGSEISNLRVNGYSNYYWLFNDQSMKATVKTNALARSARFYVNGELKFTDGEGDVQKDTSILFETDYFNLSKEGYYEIIASTYDGKEAGPVGVYVVTRTARETKYYNDTTKTLQVLKRPVVGAENIISPISAPCEMTKVGTYDRFTAVVINGVTGFVLTSELSDTAEAPIADWAFEIEEKTSDTYLWIEGNSSALSGEYVLVVRWEENGTPKLRMNDEKSMRIMGDTYKRRFRMSEDLQLEKDKLYTFEVVPRTPDGIVKVDAVEYSFTYYYGENTGIITPREGQRVRLWNTGALTIQWIRDESAKTYEVELIFAYEQDGKEVTQAVYNSGKLDAKKQKYEYKDGKDIHTLVLYADGDGIRDKVPQDVWGNKVIQATVVLKVE